MIFGYGYAFWIGLLLSGVTLGGVYALFSSGLAMIFGASKIMNFAQGEMFMIGGYVAWILATTIGLDFWSTLLVVAVALGLLGILFSVSLFRKITSGPRAAEVGIVLTLGLSIVLQEGALRIFGSTSRLPADPFGQAAISLGGVRIDYLRIAALGIAIVLLAALGLFLRYTRMGLAVKAVSSNREVSQLVGIRQSRISRFSIAVGFALSGIAGAVVAPFYGVYPTMGLGFIFVGFSILYMGGMTSIPGVILSALLVGVVTSVTSGVISSSAASLAPLVLITITLLVRPQGLFVSRRRIA